MAPETAYHHMEIASSSLRHPSFSRRLQQTASRPPADRFPQPFDPSHAEHAKQQQSPILNPISASRATIGCRREWMLLSGARTRSAEVELNHWPAPEPPKTKESKKRGSSKLHLHQQRNNPRRTSRDRIRGQSNLHSPQSASILEQINLPLRQ